MTLNTGDLHKGVTIEIDGVLFQLLDVHHIKAKRSQNSESRTSVFKIL